MHLPTAKEVLDNEDAISANPEDEVARLAYVRLLERLSFQEEYERRRVSQIVWFAQHAPSTSGVGSFSAVRWRTEYDFCVAQRDARISENPHDVKLLLASAQFLAASNPARSRSLLEVASALGANSEVNLELAQMIIYCAYYHLSADRESDLIQAFELLTAELLHNSEEFESARTFWEYERVKAFCWSDTLSSSLESYSSVNVLPEASMPHQRHYRQILKGCEAFTRERLDDSISAMIASAQVEGGFSADPVFGPDFALAKRLVRAGAVEAVAKYLAEIESRWILGEFASAWRRQLLAGSIPDFRLTIND